MTEAVDNLVYSGVAKNRWEAVQLGRKLARELNLFSHATNDHEFRDEYLFYRYNTAGHGESFSSAADASEEISEIRPRSDLAEKADAFKLCVDIRDRTYRMQPYKHCFIGAGKTSSHANADVDAAIFI